MEIQNVVDDYVLEVIEKALARAKRGEVLGIAIVIETPLGSRSSWTTENPQTLGAACYAMAHSLMVSVVEEHEEAPENLQGLPPGAN